MLESGMHLAVIYPFPVRYENSGRWDEIDNTLVLKEGEEKETYHNTAGIWDISLPTILDSNVSNTPSHTTNTATSTNSNTTTVYSNMIILALLS